MKSSYPSQDHDVIKILREGGRQKAEYPHELLKNRRAGFLDQVEQHIQVESTQELLPRDLEIAQILQRLKSVESEYPSLLLAFRRLAFKGKLLQIKLAHRWLSVRTAIENRITTVATPSRMPSMQLPRRALIVISMSVFVMVFISQKQDQLNPLSPSQNSLSEPVLVHTNTPSVHLFCKPGYLPPFCLAADFNKEFDLTYQGNGSARPAVAKDTIPGHEEIHRAAFVNDGRYGPGASWVSNSPDSWIKIDLGKPTTVNTIAFGRDRLGQLNDRDPGQFVVAVALADNVYADGNSSNDDYEYIEVFNSEHAGFSGVVSGAETVTAQFDPLDVRFIKITFEKAGTAVDEVEVFMLDPQLPGNGPTRTPKEHQPRSTATSRPTSTPPETQLPSATPLPSDTPIPTDNPPPTDTPIPTDNPLPIDTPIPDPTETPPPTDMPILLPTTPPLPTETPVTDAQIDLKERQLRQIYP